MEKSIRRLQHHKSGYVPFTTQQPSQTEMQDGEERDVMVDGTLYRYVKRQGKLYRIAWTGV